MPTHRHHPGTDQDPIRFKNLLKAAENLLRESYPRAEVREILDPLTNLSDLWFWRYQMDGLALFQSPALLATYRLPLSVPELAVVADTFHLKPLLRFLQANQRYLVLALSQKQTTLYAGTPHSLGPVDLSELPSSMTEALGIEREEPFLNVRTIGSGKAPIFHGHGAPEASRKDDLLRFFRAIDKALWEVLREERLPLILAGVDYYFPIYREVSRYTHLTSAGVAGNFDDASPEEIHARVWPVAEATLAQQEQEALTAYRSAGDRGLATTDLVTIARMTVHGRVRRLLIAEGEHVWGVLDRESGQVTVSESQQDTRDADVLDDLAEAVLARGGEVLLLPSERMPGRSPAAAILRW
jgi:hypothetical protein